MNTAQLPILEPLDRTLLETTIARRFDLSALLDPDSPNPVQHSVLAIALWFTQPHIQAATDHYIAALHRAACCAHALDITQQINGMKALFLRSLNLLKNTPDLPTDPTLASQAARELRSTIRETRLIASALKALTRPDCPSAPRRSRKAGSTLQRHHLLDPTVPDEHTAPSTASSADPSTPNQAQDRTNQPQPSVQLADSINAELHHLRADLAELHPDLISQHPVEQSTSSPDAVNQSHLQTAA